MSDVTKLDQFINRYHLDWRHPEKLARVVKRIEKGRMSPGQAKRWLKKIRPLIEKQIREGNYLPMPPRIEDLNLDEEPFDVELGVLTERPEVPFGMYITTGVHHMIIVGKPGSGKTVTLKVYIKGILDSFLADKPVFIVADSKKDFINPEIIFGDNVVHLPVLDPEKFRISMNPPPGVPVGAWAGPICTILASRLGMFASRISLSEIYKWSYPLLGGPPSPELIMDCLVNAPSNCWGEKLDYIAFLVQALQGYIIDGNGTFSAEKGFDVTDLIEKGTNCVLDIANCEPAYRRYVIFDIILLQILLYAIHNHKKTNRVRICLVIDEADLFARPSAQSVYPDNLSPLTLMARLAREYGIQIIVSVSGLQNVAPYIRTGCDCLVVHKSTDPESIWVIQNTLGIPQMEKLLPALKEGQCIFRYASCAYPYPFLGQVRLIEPDHSQKSRPYDSIPFTKSRRLKDLPHVQKALQDRINERKNTALRQSKAQRKKQNLSKHERSFLDHLSLKDYDPVHIIFSRVGNLSSGTQQKIIKHLEKLKFIETILERTGKMFVRFADLTEAGMKLLNKEPEKKEIRGNKTHRKICYLKKDLDLKNGAEKSVCEFQYPNSTGFGDVGSKFKGKWHSTEVVVNCTSNICDHVKSCFIDSQGQVESLTIVTLLKSEHRKILEKIMSAPELVFFVNRIKFMTLEDILKELYEK